MNLLTSQTYEIYAPDLATCNFVVRLYPGIFLEKIVGGRKKMGLIKMGVGGVCCGSRKISETLSGAIICPPCPHPPPPHRKTLRYIYRD